MPHAAVLPIAPPRPDRLTPDDVQATSYLAASVKSVSFCMGSIAFSLDSQQTEHVF
jgi:hypothetical protein